LQNKSSLGKRGG